MKKRHNDIFELDFKERKWSQINANGDRPAARTYHSANLIEDYLIIFGGENMGDLNDLNILNLRN